MYDDPVPMIPVESSNVESFGYDDANQVLYVRFMAKGNSPSTLYWYSGVEPDIYQAFFNAPSKGQFVWRYLRNRYEYGKME